MPGISSPIAIKTLNGLFITSMRLSVPRIGCWVADVVVNNAIDLTSGVPRGIDPVVGVPAAFILDTNTVLGSVVQVSQIDAGILHIRATGGLTGGYSRALVVPQNNSIGPTAQVAASILCSASGEAFNPALSNPVLLNTLLKGFQAFGGATLANNMSKLVAALSSASWRVDLTTGTSYITIDLMKLPAILPTGATVAEDIEGVGVVYDCPQFDVPIPLPGTIDPNTFLPVNEVVLDITPGKTLMSLFNTQQSAFLPNPVNTLATTCWHGKVISPNPDGTVNVLPDNPTVIGPALARVKASCGLPNTVVIPPPLQGVTVALPNGDPTQLFEIVAYDNTISPITFQAFPGFTVQVGAPAQPVALSQIVDENITKLIAAILKVKPNTQTEPGLIELQTALATFVVTPSAAKSFEVV